MFPETVFEFYSAGNDGTITLLNQFESLSPEIQTLVQDTSVLRVLSTGKLRHFATLRDPDQYKHTEGDFLTTYIRPLEDRNLVDWSEEKKGWVLDTSLQDELRTKLKNTNPQRYAGLHQSAQAMYGQWMIDYGENAQGYSLEVLYHAGELLGIGKKDTKQVLEEFQSLISKSIFYRLPSAEEFSWLLRNDKQTISLLTDADPNLPNQILVAIMHEQDLREKEAQTIYQYLPISPNIS